MAKAGKAICFVETHQGQAHLRGVICAPYTPSNEIKLADDIVIANLETKLVVWGAEGVQDVILGASAGSWYHLQRRDEVMEWLKSCEMEETT